MSPGISEQSFEEAIECALLENGPDACAGDFMTVRETLAPYGDGAAPGGYRKRRWQNYDRGLCLFPRDVIDFLLATPAEGVGEATAALRRGGEGTLPRAALAGDRPPWRPRRAGQRRARISSLTAVRRSESSVTTKWWNWLATTGCSRCKRAKRSALSLRTRQAVSATTSAERGWPE